MLVEYPRFYWRFQVFELLEKLLQYQQNIQCQEFMLAEYIEQAIRNIIRIPIIFLTFSGGIEMKHLLELG